MSKLFSYRNALKDSIVAADIGWTEDSIIIKRQGDLWNEVATAISAAKHGAVLHIGVASGESTDDEDLNMDVSVPLTIICLPQVEEDATPEEDLWEDLVKHVHGLELPNESYGWRFKFKGFQDLEVEADGGTSYLARQTTFTKALII